MVYLECFALPWIDWH